MTTKEDIASVAAQLAVLTRTVEEMADQLKEVRERAESDAGEHHVIAEEYAVLDRVGRLQLPRAHVEELGLRQRVRLVLEDDHIEIWPDGTDRSIDLATTPSRGADAFEDDPGTAGATPPSTHLTASTK